jgi:hypothetical protein
VGQVLHKVALVVPVVGLEGIGHQKDYRFRLHLILLVWVVVVLVGRIRITQITGQTPYLVRLPQQVVDEVRSRVQDLKLAVEMVGLAVAVRTIAEETMVVQVLASLGKVIEEGIILIIQ